ncbi:MAG: hypothetical protein ACLFSZ_04260 [Puniceicoccaceae bacterium]
MKTTLEIPDELFRQVKSTAASRGILMKEFVTEALAEKLSASAKEASRPWLALAGCAADDPEMLEEIERIDGIIEDTFGRVDEDDWK